MSGFNGQNGYYLRKTGERVNELLSRQFVVPTLDAPPTDATLQWNDGDYTVEFRIGEFVRVHVDADYVFYRLKDVSGGKAYWTEATASDMSDYYTREEIDRKLSQIIPGGGTGGGVEILTPDQYEGKKENGEIISNVIYLLLLDGEPYEMYVGLILIAKKGEIANISFPYTFPIIF